MKINDESIEITDDDKKEIEGTILEVVQKGCLLNGRLLKPAKVVVGIPKKSN